MKSRGFTMIEFMIIIALIGILATFGLSSYMKSLARGRDAKRIEDMQTIQKGYELYYAKYDQYAACEGDDGMGGDPDLFPSGLPKPPAGTIVYTYSDDCEEDQAYCVCTELENDTYANSGETRCDFGAATKTLYCVTNLQ